MKHHLLIRFRIGTVVFTIIKKSPKAKGHSLAPHGHRRIRHHSDIGHLLVHLLHLGGMVASRLAHLEIGQTGTHLDGNKIELANEGVTGGNVIGADQANQTHHGDTIKALRLRHNPSTYMARNVVIGVGETVEL